MEILEYWVDAMMAYEGWHVGSRSYRNRNPINLRRPVQGADTDQDGFRKFSSLTDGYQAALLDAHAKFSGHNAHGLGPSSFVVQYFEVHAPASDGNMPMKYAQFVAAWMSRCMQKLVTVHTLLGDIWHE